MSTGACAIWKTPAEQLESAGDYQVFDSPRAGGKYWISGSAIGRVLPLTDHAKRSLSTWICEQHRAGIEIPKVSDSVIDLIKSRQPLLIIARMNLALEYLGRRINQLGHWLTLEKADNADAQKLLAVTESKNFDELLELFKMLEISGFVQGREYAAGGAYRPTVEGWRALDDLRNPHVDSSQAFVAMWFSEEMNDVYVRGIEPALSSTGYKAVRIDKKEHNNKIDDEIIAEIRKSRFVIADFTCEPKNVRGGVYYEAGFAQGLGLPVIWTCKDASLNDLHFDTRQYSHIVWKTPEDLLVQLRNRIGATIGEGPLPKLGG